MMIGIDAHKKSCTTCIFQEDDVLTSPPSETFTFKTTMQGVTEFMGRIPEGSLVVVESSTTGKAISKLLSGRYMVHMVAPPERKLSIKTDKRDAERIIKEDMLGYVRRCYIPSQPVEVLRLIVAKQMEIAGKISAVRNQIHALLERNLLQSEFADLSDVFGVEGLERLSNLSLPPTERLTRVVYLEELNLYASQHRQMEAEIAKTAEADADCRNLMTHPGIGPFVAVALKARTGDASRFPTKKHFCSYTGVVPKTDNSGEHVSEHGRVKHGDQVLKYALTCGVNAAVKAKAYSAVKRFYLKQVAKGKSAQDAEVAAARKLACAVWRMLTSKQPYIEEDIYLTARKMSRLTQTVRRPLKHVVKPEDLPRLIANLKSETDVLNGYPVMTHGASGRRRSSRRSRSTIEHISEGNPGTDVK